MKLKGDDQSKFQVTRWNRGLIGLIHGDRRLSVQLITDEVQTNIGTVQNINQNKLKYKKRVPEGFPGNLLTLIKN